MRRRGVVQAKEMGRPTKDTNRTDSPKAASPENGAPENAAPKNDTAKRDVMLVHGRGKDGSLKVIRAREDRVEFGSVSHLEHGKPIHGEVVRLKPRADMPLICDVETQLDCRPAAALAGGRDEAATNRPGPAQVASEAYRENWDRIWKRPAASEMN